MKPTVFVPLDDAATPEEARLRIELRQWIHICKEQDKELVALRDHIVELTGQHGAIEVQLSGLEKRFQELEENYKEAVKVLHNIGDSGRMLAFAMAWGQIGLAECKREEDIYGHLLECIEELAK